MKKGRKLFPSELESKIPGLHGALSNNVPPTGPLADLLHAMLQSEARTAEQYQQYLEQNIACRRQRLIATFDPPAEDHQPELIEFDRTANRIQQEVMDVLYPNTSSDRRPT